MSNECYLQLLRTDGTSAYIELDKEVPVSLNISVTEVQDISKKNNSYTKQIAIPNTAQNNKVFGQLWNINAANPQFDIAVRNRCLLWSGGVIVLRGYIQITGVKRTSVTNSQGEQLMYYQAILTDDTSEFIDRIGDGYLHDMDLSRYDHYLVPQTILSSSTHTWEQGYTYPHLYRSGGPYEPMDFKPAIFAKTYVEQMFEDAGYTWSGSAMNSPIYESLVVPYNGVAVSADNRDFQYVVGFSAASSSYGWTQVNGSNQQGLGTLTPVRFDLDNTAPFSNPFGHYSTTTGLATSQYNGPETLHANWTLDIGLRANVDSYLFGQGYNGASVGSELADSYLEFNVKVYLGQTGQPLGGSITSANLIATASTSVNYYNSITNLRAAQAAGPIFGVAAGDTLMTSVTITGISYSFLCQQLKSQGVWVEVTYRKGAGNNSGWWTSNLPGGTPVGTIPRILIRQGFVTSSSNSSFYNDATTWQVQGSTVGINSFIPRNVKKKDFFSSMCQMFNWCVESDPDNETNLHIDSRDDYYNSGTTVDWSDKIDLSKEVEIRFLTELQGKKTINFTWTDDSEDVRLKEYKANNNLVYGQLLVDVENQFLSGERTIKPIFSMTPTVENYYNQPVPFINSREPKTSLRVLSKGGAVSGSWDFAYLTAGTLTTQTLSSYNWCGEYDHPLTPQWNLSWTMNEDVYYDELQYIPFDDLYDKYYYNTVQSILDSKMLIAQFHITQKDIARLKLNTKIWLEYTKCYFVINRIVDYNPVKKGLTKVELLRFD